MEDGLEMRRLLLLRTCGGSSQLCQPWSSIGLATHRLLCSHDFTGKISSQFPRFTFEAPICFVHVISV